MRDVDFNFICEVNNLDPEVVRENPEVQKFLKRNKNNNSTFCHLTFSGLLKLEFNKS